MAPGTDAVACLGKLENGFCIEHEKDPIFDHKPHEVYDDSTQSKASRPPLMRHCSSHATLADPFSTVSQMVFECGINVGFLASAFDRRS